MRRNKETKELVCQCRRLPRGVRGETGRTLDGGMIGMNEVNLRRRDDDKVLFTRSSAARLGLRAVSTCPIASYLILPDLDYLSAGRYQIIHKMIREGTIGLSRQSSE